MLITDINKICSDLQAFWGRNLYAPQFFIQLTVRPHFNYRLVEQQNSEWFTICSPGFDKEQKSDYLITLPV